MCKSVKMWQRMQEDLDYSSLPYQKQNTNIYIVKSLCVYLNSVKYHTYE